MSADLTLSFGLFALGTLQWIGSSVCILTSSGTFPPEGGGIYGQSWNDLFDVRVCSPLRVREIAVRHGFARMADALRQAHARTRISTIASGLKIDGRRAYSLAGAGWTSSSSSGPQTLASDLARIQARRTVPVAVIVETPVSQSSNYSV